MRPVVVACALALVACSDTDFTPRWKVDRFRLLAIVADPPDALAGESVTLTALTADRAGMNRDVAIAWVSCGRAMINNDTGNRACAMGGALPLTGNPVRVAITDAASDGSPWSVFGMVCAGGVPTIDAATMQPRCMGGEGEIFLRSIRQRVGAPNHNPRITRLTLDGVEMSATTPSRIAPCAITGSDARTNGCVHHVVRVEFAADSREPIAQVQPDGSTRTLPEALVTEFMVDGGDLDEAFRSDNDSEGGLTAHANTLLAPAMGPVRLWAITRDGRGGFDTALRVINVGPP